MICNIFFLIHLSIACYLPNHSCTIDSYLDTFSQAHLYCEAFGKLYSRDFCSRMYILLSNQSILNTHSEMWMWFTWEAFNNDVDRILPIRSWANTYVPSSIYSWSIQPLCVLHSGLKCECVTLESMICRSVTRLNLVTCIFLFWETDYNQPF